MTKEGLYFPLPFFVVAIVFFYLFRVVVVISFLYLAVLFFYLGLGVMLFFRDPERKIPEGDGLILSPADGRILRIDNESKAPSLSIFLSIHNVHVNRSPVCGTVKSVVFHPGKFLAANRREAGSENQRNEIEIETDKGIVRMNQVSGAIARRTIFDKKPGERVKAGERIGLIRFGSRVDLQLPAGTAVDVRIRQKVKAGETVIGRLP
jgi:phosphatidylserine decarboxylase